MTARADTAAERSSPDGSGPGVVAWYAEAFRDAIGDRLLLFDSTGPGLELLRVRADLAKADGFEAMLRARVDALRSFRHPAFAAVRAVKWLEDLHPCLAVVSDHVQGERLSRVLRVARSRGLRPGPEAVIWLLRALMPGVAALHEHQGIAHGLLSADRIVVGSDGRLTIADYVFGAAIERQRLTPYELWERFGIAIMPGRAGAGLSRRADIEQVARLGIAMLSDRVDVTTPGPLPPAELLAQVRGHLAKGPDRRLGDWLARALGVEQPAFETAREAQYALDGMLPRRVGTWAPWLLPAAELDATVRAGRPALPGPVEEDSQEDELGATVLMTREELEAMSAMARDAAAAAARKSARPRWQRALPYVAGAAAVVALVEGALLVRTWRTRPQPAPLTDAASAALPSEPQSGLPSAQGPPRPVRTAAPAATGGSDAPRVAPTKAEGTSGTARAPRQLPSPVAGAAALGVPAGKTAAPDGAIGWVAVKASVDVRVYANGRFLGTSTDEAYRLPEGTHEIHLVNERARIDERHYVRIVSGQTVTLSPRPAAGD